MATQNDECSANNLAHDFFAILVVLTCVVSFDMGSRCGVMSELCSDVFRGGMSELCSDVFCGGMSELCSDVFRGGMSELCSDVFCGGMSELCSDVFRGGMSELCSDFSCVFYLLICMGALAWRP